MSEMQDSRSVVVPFVPENERISSKNFDDFIEFQKQNCRFFRGPDAIEWESMRWELTPFYPKRANTKTTAIFSKVGFGKEPFEDLFANQVKAILCEHLRISSDSQVSKFIGTLRHVRTALLQQSTEADIRECSNLTFDLAAQAAKQATSDPWSSGRTLENISMSIIERCALSKHSLSWKSPFKFKAARRSNSTKYLEEQTRPDDRSDKLPDLRCVFDLSSVFVNSNANPDTAITSWFALAMFAPSRINEILTLPVRCTTSQDLDGEIFKGIMWRPEKGGQPVTKWAINSEFMDVAEAAISKMMKAGEKAREAARWYETNPDELFLPHDLEHLRGEPITYLEWSKILGASRPLEHRSMPPSYFNLESVGKTTNDPQRGATNGRHVKLFEQRSGFAYVKNRLPDNFPVADPVTGLKYSEALFTIPANFMRANISWRGKRGAPILHHIPSFLTSHMVSHELGNKPDGKDIFERNELCNPDTGKYWSLNTHQPRHLINTLAQSKYLSQELIAFWSGRKSTTQNDFYNHLPQEAYIEAWQRLGEDAPRDIHVVGSLDEKTNERSSNEEITYDEALRLELGSCHITRFGVCRHNFALTPCPKDKDCINCGENLFIKGDKRQIREAKDQLAIHTKAVANCVEQIEAGEPGVERWLDIHQRKKTRWEDALSKMCDAGIEDGTLITLPPPEISQSKSGLSFEIRSVETTNGLDTEETEAGSEEVNEIESFDEIWGDE